jgi:hypothetical protein
MNEMVKMVDVQSPPDVDTPCVMYQEWTAQPQRRYTANKVIATDGVCMLCCLRELA